MIPLGRCLFQERFVAVILIVSAATCALGAEVQLKGFWLMENQQWTIRIGPATHAGIQIQQGRHLFVEVIDPATRQHVPFQLKSGSPRYVDLAFPQFQRPANVSVIVRGLLLLDSTGRRVSYDERLTVMAPPAAAGERRPAALPTPAYHSLSADYPHAPENTGATGQGAPAPMPLNAPPIEPAGGAAPPPPAPPLGPPVITGAGAPPETEFPQFPFPPPMASAFETIPRELLVASKAHPKLKDVDAALSSAFARCGYGEKSFYAVPDGFAMASRLEQINADGSVGANRWSLETAPIKSFSIDSYLSALFRARAGHFRVVVFLITNHPFGQTDARITSAQAKSWVKKGLNELPRKIGDRDYTDEYNCTALIYEFKTLGGGEAIFVEPSEITGRTHLEKSGLLTALSRPR